jgi:hypothetical protein
LLSKSNVDFTSPLEDEISGEPHSKAETRAEIESIILNDPFNREKIAEYEIIEFVPSMATTHLAKLREA